MRQVFIRGHTGSFNVVVKPHPGVGRVAGNMFGLATHEAAVEAAGALAGQWGCDVLDETEE